MTFWAYILRCNDGSYYTGHTEDLERRIGQHTTGHIPGRTKHRRPVTLEWSEEFPSRIEALEAERRIKGWGAAKKRALIAGDWTLLQLLARNWQGAGHPSTSSGRTGFGGDGSPPVRPELVEGQPTAQSEPTSAI